MSENKLHAALVKAWSEMPTIEHDRQNPHFKNTYATFDNIIRKVREVLAKNDLALTQDPEIREGFEHHAVVCNTLVHVSGETMHMGTIAVPSKKKDDPQAFGSAMTYAKRYALCSIFGIPTGEDDDGNAAAQEASDPRKKAFAAIAEWSGLSGSDLTQAAREVASVAGSDPERIIAYVNEHKNEDFVEHMTSIKETA